MPPPSLRERLRRCRLAAAKFRYGPPAAMRDAVLKKLTPLAQMGEAHINNAVISGELEVQRNQYNTVADVFNLLRGSPRMKLDDVDINELSVLVELIVKSIRRILWKKLIGGYKEYEQSDVKFKFQLPADYDPYQSSVNLQRFYADKDQIVLNV